ncbi:hypothetical protein [Aliikangiella sp. IMCC44359]|uniref:hypothetical protein n=1 Tax=Aliikangiella sp. IMCC44359 TaxID=3459125 RepID=UPI00403AEF13
MPTKRQKELGLDTVKIEDVPKGYANIFNDLLKVRAEVQNKTIQEVFQDVTEELLEASYSPEHVKRILRLETDKKVDFE